MLSRASTTSGGHPRRWWILSALCLILFVVMVDNTIANVAIPSIASDLDASATQLQWIVNGYSLTLAALLIVAGSLSDRYGRKKGLLGGLALFALGSLIGTLAPTADVLVLARVLMGIGGAFLLPGTLGTLVRTFNDQDRPRAIGIWAAASAAALGMGPVIGGLLLDHFTWHSVFLVNVPVALVAAISLGVLLDESSDGTSRQVDVAGAMLLALTITALVWSISAASQAEATSWTVVLSSALAFTAGTIFVMWERRHPAPILNLGLARNARFRAAVLGGVLTSLGMGGSLFVLTQNLQFLRGYSPLQAGIQLLPMAAGVFLVSSFLSARVLRNLGLGRGIALGVTIEGFGLALLGFAPLDNAWVMTVGLALVGSGAGITGPLVSNALISSIPPAQANTGSGVNGTLQEIGSGLGVATFAMATTLFFSQNVPDSLRSAASQSFLAAMNTAGSPDAVDSVQRSFASATSISLVLGAGAVLAGGILTGILLTHAERASAESKTGTSEGAAGL